MRKAQVLKFWKALDDSTDSGSVVKALANKKGYGGERTLGRFVQAKLGFEKGSSLEDIASKTGWSMNQVEKIHGWWETEFGNTEGSPHVEGKPPSMGGADRARYAEHFDEMATQLDMLLGDIKVLVRLKNEIVKVEGNLVDGMTVYTTKRVFPMGVLAGAEYPAAKDLLVHLENHPDFHLDPRKLALEDINDDLFSHLRALYVSKAFMRAPKCQVCRLMGFETNA